MQWCADNHDGDGGDGDGDGDDVTGIFDEGDQVDVNDDTNGMGRSSSLPSPLLLFSRTVAGAGVDAVATVAEIDRFFGGI